MRIVARSFKEDIRNVMGVANTGKGGEEKNEERRGVKDNCNQPGRR